MESPDAKKKRVSFGPNLNPEHFDKLLPPSAPVSKGEKPGSGHLVVGTGSGVTESPLISGGSTRYNNNTVFVISSNIGTVLYW